jgi:hypothetical protein
MIHKIITWVKDGLCVAVSINEDKFSVFRGDDDMEWSFIGECLETEESFRKGWDIVESIQCKHCIHFIVCDKVDFS